MLEYTPDEWSPTEKRGKSIGRPSMPEQKPGRSRQDYGTPPELLLAVANRLRLDGWFSYDLAASKENTVVEDYFYTEEDNALTKFWHYIDGWCWLNPPFADIEPWVKKAQYEATKGAHIVMLVPASVGSNWWANWVAGLCYQVFIGPRLTFVGETTPYPKDCALLFYTPWGFKGNEVWRWKP